MILPTLLLIFCGLTAEAAYPLKILGLFPHPGVSHFHFFHPIMRGLADAGHDVTVVSHFPDKSPPIRYKDLPLKNSEHLTNSVDLKMFENRHFYNHFLEFTMLHKWGIEACNHTLKSDALAQVLRQKIRYDVIIMEQFNSDCMMGVAHVLKAPVVALSSCALMPWHYARMSNPMFPSYIPALFLGNSEEMNYVERLSNWITFHGLNIFYQLLSVPATDALVRYKFGHDMPSVGDLAKTTSLMLVNQHFSLNGAKPLPPSVIEVGGTHIQKAKALDDELQRLLDKAEYGVILISWGSMIRAESLPAAKRDAIIKVVNRLKQQVIWKWENDTIPNKPSNLYIRKWLPQREILCHPNVRAFMTHGGLMGSLEAAYCGVPVIATPMYGDQFLNSAAMKQRGMGVILNYEDITENNVMRATKKVLEKSYLENARKISHSFKHRPQTALQTAIWWIEYVARTEGAPLTKSSALFMSSFVYHSLDVYIVIGILLGMWLYSWYWIYKNIFKKKPSNQSNQSKEKTN